MFEKETEEYINKLTKDWSDGEYSFSVEELRQAILHFAEFGYNKANEEARLKLKDEGIVKPLKDSILRNERLSSQEQQELCAWIECAMDFGENLDECAKELEEANKANEWHYVKDELPELYKDVLVVFPRGDCDVKRLTNHNEWIGRGSWCSLTDVIAWKEIVLPELKESE